MESTDFDQTASKPRAQRRRPDRGTAWSVVASLLWLPQAALLATAVQWMATGRAAEVGGLALGLLVLGAAKAWCEGHGMRLSFEAARAQLDTLRAQVVQALASSSPLDTRRVPSGQAASAVAEQAEAIVPWLSRYQTAMWRTRVLPLVIAAVVAWQSWVAALILVVAAPLIPLFMAIVGWRAQAASQEQMVQLGQMNGFLLDRLRGLTTLRALGAVDATALRLRAHAESLRQRTLRVLRIAFLSSAVLELFSALGVAMVAVATGVVTVVIGALPFLGLVVPNLVSMVRGDNLRTNLPWVVMVGVWIVIVCDLIGRTVIAPFEVPISLILGLVGAIVFLALLLRQAKHG